MPRSPISKLVESLEPGQQIEISSQEIELHSPGGHYNGAFFAPADNVMESIVGSAYEYWYVENFDRNSVTFGRLSEPLSLDDDRQAYVSPDRRQHFDYDGLFWRRKKRDED